MLSLQIDGNRYVLRPDFDVFVRIEQALSASIFVLARKLADGEMSLQELRVVMEHGLDPTPPLPSLEAHIMRCGMAQAAQWAAALFSEALAGAGKAAAPMTG